MRQSVLDRSVARATGESVSMIRRMGFTLVCPPALPSRGRLKGSWRRSRRRRFLGGSRSGHAV